MGPPFWSNSNVSQGPGNSRSLGKNRFESCDLRTPAGSNAILSFEKMGSQIQGSAHGERLWSNLQTRQTGLVQKVKLDFANADISQKLKALW
jgi:hypothetical protein